MALLTAPRTRGKHAAKTPIWRQFGIGRPRHELTAARLVSPPAPEPAAPADRAAAPQVSADTAREVVGRLFPDGADGLFPLDWRYSQGRASAQVAPGLVVDAARNVVLAYAAALDAPFVQDDVDGRQHMRVSRAVDAVQITVWADITPDAQEQRALPAPAPVPAADPVLPIEATVRRCVLDETQSFPAITDDMDDPREHPDAAPDGNPEPQPDGDQEHPSRPDTASTDTTSPPLPPGDEDEQEEVAVRG